MGRPKLPDEEVQAQIPLRLPKTIAAALEDIARSWGEKSGKEVKRGTVAREMVLIGLGTFMALQHNKMLAEFSRDTDTTDDQQARLAEITAAADDVLSQAKNRNLDPDLAEKAIMQSLKAIRDTLLGNTPIPTEPISLPADQHMQYPTEPRIRQKVKGGRK